MQTPTRNKRNHLRGGGTPMPPQDAPALDSRRQLQGENPKLVENLRRRGGLITTQTEQLQQRVKLPTQAQRGRETPGEDPR